MESVCIYGYYGTDMCLQEFSQDQLEAIGLGSKSDEELGLGEFCVDINRIFTDFTQEQLDEGISIGNLSDKYGIDYQFVWMEACAKNSWWAYYDYCNKVDYYWEYRAWQDLSKFESEADWS